MEQLTQALLGWSIVMAMVFGGVAVLFFLMSSLRSLASLAGLRKIARKQAAPESQASR